MLREFWTRCCGEAVIVSSKCGGKDKHRRRTASFEFACCWGLLCYVSPFSLSSPWVVIRWEAQPYLLCHCVCSLYQVLVPRAKHSGTRQAGRSPDLSWGGQISFPSVLIEISYTVLCVYQKFIPTLRVTVY